MQLRELKEYSSARGWQIVKVYEDVGFTGRNDKRPQYQALMRDAKMGKFDVLICFKLDRLFRSLKHLISALEELSELGVEFVSLRDQIDLTTSSGRLMLHMIGAFAEFESDIIRSRVKAGLENARAKGKSLGRKRERDDDRIALLRSQGLSIKKIAQDIGMSKKTVQNSLKGRQIISFVPLCQDET